MTWSNPYPAYSENVVGTGAPAANRGILRKTRTVITRFVSELDVLELALREFPRDPIDSRAGGLSFDAHDDRQYVAGLGRSVRHSAPPKP